MSILAKIFDKIFPWADGHTPSPAQPTPAQNSSPASPKIETPSASAPSSLSPTPSSTSSSSPTSVSTESTAPVSEVDVEKTLNELAKNSGQTLNWRTSIVDLLKLLDLDSSLQARKELAHELEYPGDTNDSATMNIWLHKELMKTLAANGGKVPAELRD